MNRIAVAFFAFGFALSASAATPPSQPRQPRDTKMTNVYSLAHAGAILEVCRASPEAEAFPEEKSREISELSGRLAELVRTIGQYYRDGEVPSVYEATKANMAADTKLRFHVKNNHQFCGERTLTEMRAYVTGNEASFKAFFDRRRQEEQARKAK